MFAKFAQYLPQLNNEPSRTSHQIFQKFAPLIAKPTRIQHLTSNYNFYTLIR